MRCASADDGGHSGLTRLELQHVRGTADDRRENDEDEEDAHSGQSPQYRCSSHGSPTLW